MRGSWHPRLWLPLAAAGSLTLTPVADTAERELWAGTVTYRKKIATKCKSAVRGKDCTASCSIDEVLPDMEVVLGVVIPPHRWEDLSRPVKLRYTWKQDDKGSWVRNSETCCGKKNVKSPKACTRADLPLRKERPASGSFTEPQISLLPPTPSADRAGRQFDCQPYAHSCNSCQCPGSATTMEEAVVVDLKRATCSDVERTDERRPAGFGCPQAASGSKSAVKCRSTAGAFVIR